MEKTYEPGATENQLPASAASWLDRPLLARVKINAETILFFAILIVAVFTRFYDLGARVMSHDENTHVIFSWQLYKGQGYQHNPLTHGPFLFHITALSYFLFGDSDLTARLPQALFGIATIAFIWNFRRYLGRVGALVAAVLFLISPYMLYYARYARNEAWVAFYGVVTLWSILRYLESGKHRYLYYLTAATIFHFVSKETAFIYTAQALLFLALFLAYKLITSPWKDNWFRTPFVIVLIVSVLLLGGAAGSLLTSFGGEAPSATETIAPVVPGAEGAPEVSTAPPVLALVLGALGALALGMAAYFLLRGYSLPSLRTERSFDMLIVLGTLVLPMLAPFPLRWLGLPVPHDVAGVNALTIPIMIQMGIVTGVFILLSIGIGLWWNASLWLRLAAIWYGVAAVLFTTVFTNGAGFITGILGSLGYWLEQQGVQRGSQPWYYYALVQVPVYEYLAALGSLMAIFAAFFMWRRQRESGPPPAFERPLEDDKILTRDEVTPNQWPVVALLGFWSITALFAYSFAGEKMPWLTVHIALPMLLLASWALGKLIEAIDWKLFLAYRGLLVLIVLPVFLISLWMMVSSLLGATPPFQGKDLQSLMATSTFLFALITTVLSGWGLFYLVRSWPQGQLARVMVLAFFALLGVLTARTAITSSFINYDYANELLVYAHSAPGPKIALEQIEELSRRTTGGLDIQIAYDNTTNYPYWWYLRNYPNKLYYGADPTRSLRDAPVIAVGDENFSKIEPVVRDDYYLFDYIRIWWPNQDYFNLDWERISNALRDPQLRAGLFQIWLNRDYTDYFRATGQDLSLTNWTPAQWMRLYVRKDIAAQIWDYGVGPTAVEPVVDPYEGKQVTLQPDQILGGFGTEPGQFNKPRGIAFAPDGSLYISDTANHRIQHLAPDGTVLHVWGSYGWIEAGNGAEGTFNEPWGIEVGPDGSVFVADTWNHRIQKFTSEGEFVKMWGYFGQAEAPEAFWGPRDIVIDAEGRLYVTDTGNKRVVVFNTEGEFITQFGSVGLGPGQFDEPVGLALGPQGEIYVADTWNQRIQMFVLEGDQYIPAREWEVDAWYGQSLDNKPFLDAAPSGNVFITDPEANRVIEFMPDGQIVRYWEDISPGSPEIAPMVGAVAIEEDNSLWVTDAGAGRILHYTLPAP
jgi:DNA-binding beta-propeller fold protein YncE